VRSFSPFTEDLYRLAHWLRACAIETVVMESTGFYWIALFQILEARGFEVCLVECTVLPEFSGPADRCLRLPGVMLLSFGWIAAAFVSVTRWTWRPGAIVAVTLRGADVGDSATIQETVAEAGERITGVVAASNGDEVVKQVSADGPHEVVTDKGYHSRALVSELTEWGLRTYCSVPNRGPRHRRGQ
jgi:hypothetical protein